MGLDIFPDQLLILLLLSIRVLAILTLVPITSSQYSPFFVRVTLAIVTAFAIQNLVNDNIILPKNLGDFIILCVGELLIGVVIGFFIQMTFEFLGIFSEFFSTQMGLRAAQVVNPLTQDQVAVIGQFSSLMMLLVFISSFGLQRVFYYGIAQSFMVLQAQDLFAQAQNNSFLSFVFISFAKLFERSFIIAMPIFTALVLVNVGLGIFGKIAPQMNLLVLGIPLQIAVGLLIFMILIPNIIHAAEILWEFSFESIETFLRGVTVNG